MESRDAALGICIERINQFPDSAATQGVIGLLLSGRQGTVSHRRRVKMSDYRTTPIQTASWYTSRRDNGVVENADKSTVASTCMPY